MASYRTPEVVFHSVNEIGRRVMDGEELRRRYAAGERNFACIDMSDAALKNANLSGANLSGAQSEWKY